MPLPEVPGILTADQLRATVDAIASWQLPNGMIPWFPGGHADPWNHVEAAMALAIGGRRAEAERAYRWLAELQRPDGSWHQYYLEQSIEQDKLDANVIAYVATGVWHHHLLFDDRGFIEAMWPTVEAAIDFVLDLQTPRGEILWARHADGTPWSFALLTGSSSICHSLRCAIALAEHLGHERPDWELSAARLAHVISAHAAGEMPDAFAPKHRWAMDWYYPVMAGVVGGDRRPRAARRPQRHVHRRRHGRALRQRSPVDHRGRDLRVPAGLPQPGRAREGPRAVQLGPAAAGRRRPLLHRHRVPRDGALPRQRALHATPRRRSCWPPTRWPARPRHHSCSSTTARCPR